MHLPRKFSPNTHPGSALVLDPSFQTCKRGSEEPVGAAPSVLLCSMAQAETMTVTEAMI